MLPSMLALSRFMSLARASTLVISSMVFISAGVGLPGTGAVGTVKNVCLCGGVKAVVHQLLLHQHPESASMLGEEAGHFASRSAWTALATRAASTALPSPVASRDLSTAEAILPCVIEHHTTIALDNALNHIVSSFFTYFMPICCGGPNHGAQYLVFSSRLRHYILTQRICDVKGKKRESDKKTQNFVAFQKECHKMLCYVKELTPYGYNSVPNGIKRRSAAGQREQ